MDDTELKCIISIPINEIVKHHSKLNSHSRLPRTVYCVLVEKYLVVYKNRDACTSIKWLPLIRNTILDFNNEKSKFSLKIGDFVFEFTEDTKIITEWVTNIQNCLARCHEIIITAKFQIAEVKLNGVDTILLLEEFSSDLLVYESEKEHKFNIIAQVYNIKDLQLQSYDTTKPKQLVLSCNDYTIRIIFSDKELVRRWIELLENIHKETVEVHLVHQIIRLTEKMSCADCECAPAHTHWLSWKLLVTLCNRCAAQHVNDSISSDMLHLSTTGLTAHLHHHLLDNQEVIEQCLRKLLLASSSTTSNDSGTQTQKCNTEFWLARNTRPDMHGAQVSADVDNFIQRKYIHRQFVDPSYTSMSQEQLKDSLMTAVKSDDLFLTYRLWHSLDYRDQGFVKQLLDQAEQSNQSLQREFVRIQSRLIDHQERPRNESSPKPLYEVVVNLALNCLPSPESSSDGSVDNSNMQAGAVEDRCCQGLFEVQLYERHIRLQIDVGHSVHHQRRMVDVCRLSYDQLALVYLQDTNLVICLSSAFLFAVPRMQDTQTLPVVFALTILGKTPGDVGGGNASNEAPAACSWLQDLMQKLLRRTVMKGGGSNCEEVHRSNNLYARMPVVHHLPGQAPLDSGTCNKNHHQAQKSESKRCTQQTTLDGDEHCCSRLYKRANNLLIQHEQQPQGSHICVSLVNVCSLVSKRNLSLTLILNHNSSLSLYPPTVTAYHWLHLVMTQTVMCCHVLPNTTIEMLLLLIRNQAFGRPDVFTKKCSDQVVSQLYSRLIANPHFRISTDQFSLDVVGAVCMEQLRNLDPRLVSDLVTLEQFAAVSQAGTNKGLSWQAQQYQLLLGELPDSQCKQLLRPLLETLNIFYNYFTRQKAQESLEMVDLDSELQKSELKSLLEFLSETFAFMIYNSSDSTVNRRDVTNTTAAILRDFVEGFYDIFQYTAAERSYVNDFLDSISRPGGTKVVKQLMVENVVCSSLMIASGWFMSNSTKTTGNRTSTSDRRISLSASGSSDNLRYTAHANIVNNYNTVHELLQQCFEEPSAVQLIEFVRVSNSLDICPGGDTWWRLVMPCETIESVFLEDLRLTSQYGLSEHLFMFQPCKMDDNNNSVDKSVGFRCQCEMKLERLPGAGMGSDPSISAIAAADDATLPFSSTLRHRLSLSRLSKTDKVGVVNGTTQKVQLKLLQPGIMKLSSLNTDEEVLSLVQDFQSRLKVYRRKRQPKSLIILHDNHMVKIKIDSVEEMNIIVDFLNR